MSFRFLKRIKSLVILGFLLLLFLGGSYLFVSSYLDIPLHPENDETIVLIESGTSTKKTAAILREKGVIDSEWLFLLSYNLFFKDTPLKAGEYKFEQGKETPLTLRSVLSALTEGKVMFRKLTIQEGLTSLEIFEIINQAEGLSEELSGSLPEGGILPDTYYYTHGESRIALLARLKAERNNFWLKSWENRDPSIKLTREEAEILASIVEREAHLDSERARIAGVFYNRLNKGMKLQSDPTVVYDLSDGRSNLGRKITRSDLQEDSPYNTYKIDGLTPTPICHPGKASIEAVLRPEKTSHLFFVADGVGGHRFAATNAEHERNIDIYRAFQQQQEAPSVVLSPVMLGPPLPTSLQIPVTPSVAPTPLVVPAQIPAQ
jgi:UPF0755 protein